MWVNDALKARFGLASEAVQRQFDTAWTLEYESHYHSVYELAPGVYGLLVEDGHQGDGLYVFEYGDWSLEESKRIDSSRHGWLLRLLRLIEKLPGLV
jgi:hypothetical protein